MSRRLVSMALAMFGSSIRSPRSPSSPAGSSYHEASIFCRRIADHENAEFFHGLLQDELHHAAEIDAWLAKLGVPQQPGSDERAYF